MLLWPPRASLNHVCFFIPLDDCLKQLLISTGDGQDVFNKNQDTAVKEKMQIQAAGDECGEPGDKVKMMADVQKATDDYMM